MREYDVAVIGGGPAGMAAALGAEAAGASVLLAERGDRLGGILNQCAHRGFGLKYFGEELTGVEYAERFVKLVAASDIETLTGTTALKIMRDRELLLSGKTLERVTAKAIVLASGCRERPIGALPVYGSRPSGIFAAGTAQRMLNIGGYNIGKRAVILGSGDVGMIVARELKLRGGEVAAVIEQRGVCGGLERNRVTCLEAYDIPLVLRSTVTRIHGSGRITGVTVRDASGAEFHIPCDALIVSVGLIPEREVMEGVSEPGGTPDFLFICGNACFVHDLVDDVTEESERAGGFAAEFAASPHAAVTARGPQMPVPRISRGDGAAICVACPKECVITKTPGGYAGMACGREAPVLSNA